MKDKIIIKQTRTEFIKFSISAIIMSLLSLCCCFVNFAPKSGPFAALMQFQPVYILFKIILALGFIFFGMCFVFGYRRFKAGGLILVVDNQGIMDYSTWSSLGLLSWNDVGNIYIKKYLGNKYIRVTVNNKQKYAESAKGSKKFNFLFHKKKESFDVDITLNYTSVTPEEVLPLINEMRTKFACTQTE